MNYYYDVNLNFLDNYYKEFEWNSEDKIKIINKIPLIPINFKTFTEIYSSKIKVSNEFLKLIEGKTKYKTGYINYSCIFTDLSSSVAVIFNKKGESIFYSTLSYEDELSIEDISYTLKKYKLEYEVMSSLPKSVNRKEIIMKTYIEDELDTLMRNKDFEKLKFLYHYIFYKVPSSNKNIIKELKNKLNTFNEDMYKLYDILKISNKSV